MQSVDDHSRVAFVKAMKGELSARGRRAMRSTM
jgi:hypothetical protein